MASLISTNIQGRINTNSSQTLPKTRIGESTSKFLLWGQNYLDIRKTGKENRKKVKEKEKRTLHKKRNHRPIFLMNIDTKNPQQNTSKQNPITYEKNYTLWSSEIFPIILGLINN